MKKGPNQSPGPTLTIGPFFRRLPARGQVFSSGGLISNVRQDAAAPSFFMAKSIPRTIDYVEIPTKDIACSRTFFSALFGWTFTDYGPDYTSFEDGRITGGFFRSEKTSKCDAG